MSATTRNGSHELYESTDEGGMAVEKLQRERKRKRDRETERMGRRRDAPVDIHKLAKLRELRFCSKSLLGGARALPLQDSSMVLGKCRRISLVPFRDCQRESGVCFIYVRQFAIGLRDVEEIRNQLEKVKAAMKIPMIKDEAISG